jgi:hypothetical protein
MKGLRLLIMATVFANAGMFTALTPQINTAQAQGGGGNTVVTQQSAQWVEGNRRITPAQGVAGTTPFQNFRPYNLPGEFIQETPPPGAIITGTYDIAYANTTPTGTFRQPVQSSDWWTGVGLQWPGWVQGVDPTNPVIRTPAFFNEPWNLNFIDLPNDAQYNKVAPGLPIAPQGLRLFNRTAMRIVTYATVPTDTMTAATAVFGYGDNAQQDSPIVTIGLSGTHPIAANTPLTPTQAPWTNVQIQRYSDWGVEMSYAGNGSAVNFTMVNGSPFVWAQRTQGSAPFVVWAGTAVSGDDAGAVSVWRNSNGVVGVNVTNSFVPIGPFAGAPFNLPNPAAYAIIADTGTWSQTVSTDPNQRQMFFQNDAAARAVVVAMPHNVPLTDTAALNAALDELIPYAAQRITDTQVHYPPIPGSQTSVIINGAPKPLGYDRDSATIRLKHAVMTEPFIAAYPATSTLQLVFPHHRKAMIAQDKANILTGNNGRPKYTWLTLKGELQAYAGDSYVRELRARGELPFLPNIAMNSTAAANGQVPASDVYQTMKQWFYKSEPNLGQDSGSFTRQNQSYFGGEQNTYAPGLATLFEGLHIADQLSKAPALSAPDPDIKLTKNSAAGVMRDFILDTLKEFMGRLANVYTSNIFQYNTDFDSFFGYPEGYQSVQNLDDKHYHYGYLLRSAAAIGRRDPAWLQAYLPFFNEVRSDVANYDRSSTRYPFLRNFSPFYGHNWADGVANGGNGNNQESTSEAINFSVGLIELGQVLGNDDWVDIGMYLYEEEILATQQYWFNQDGNPNASSGQFLNGNWPDAFVQYQSNQGPRKNYYVARIIQVQTDRATFFAQDVTAQLAIQATPLSAPHLYFGRNQQWLSEMWTEYINQRNGESAAQNTAYENLIAGVQAQVAGAGTGIADAGPFGALARVNNGHDLFFGAMNMQAKHWAYSLNALGPIDASVVADTPNYAVFCKGATGAKCAGGTRAFVAYNPTNADVTVTFEDADTGATVITLDVPAQSMTTQVGNGAATSETITQATVPSRSRLYLRKPDGYSATCDPQAPVTLTLSTSAGTWRQTGGTTAFPTDASALGPSIACVPNRTRGNPPEPPNLFPDPSLTRVWSGTFSGNLITQTAYTRFNIYTNQSLFPGWQSNPCVAGGPNVPASCPNGNWASYVITNTNGTTSTIYAAANVIGMQMWYDFDGNGVTDRIECYQNMPLDVSNTWSYGNKLTEYATDAPWPNQTGFPVVLDCIAGQKKAPFPPNIPSDKPATVTLYLYGGSNREDANGKVSQFPVPVSVNASPLTNRASWIQPPYQPLTGLRPPQRKLHFPWITFQPPNAHVSNSGRLGR